MTGEHERLERVFAQRPELRGLPWACERAALVGPPGSADAARERWTFTFILPAGDDADGGGPAGPPRVLKLTLDGAGNVLKTIGSKNARHAVRRDARGGTMSDTTITVNGQEYVLCPGGAFVDLDGNLCGFVGADITRDRDTPHFVDQMVETFAAKAEQTGAKGVGGTALRLGSRASMAFTAPQMVAIGAVAVGGAMIGRAAHEYWEASNEADAAEARAREMDARVKEARARHGR